MSEAADLNVLNFERHKWAGVRHDQPHYALLDLELFLREPAMLPSSEDVRIFRELVSAIEAAARDVIVAILGFCGVLETRDHPGYSRRFVPYHERTLPGRRFVDMPYPRAGGTAKQGSAWKPCTSTSDMYCDAAQAHDVPGAPQRASPAFPGWWLPASGVSMDDPTYSVEPRWSGGEDEPAPSRLAEIVRELDVKDGEHPDTWLSHSESGWTRKVMRTWKSNAGVWRLHLERRTRFLERFPCPDDRLPRDFFWTIAKGPVWCLRRRSVAVVAAFRAASD